MPRRNPVALIMAGLVVAACLSIQAFALLSSFRDSLASAVPVPLSAQGLAASHETHGNQAHAFQAAFVRFTVSVPNPSYGRPRRLGFADSPAQRTSLPFVFTSLQQPGVSAQLRTPFRQQFRIRPPPFA